MKTTGENKVLKNRNGIQMTEEEKTEWKNAFIDIEESIENLYNADEKIKLGYLRMKQQELF